MANPDESALAVVPPAATPFPTTVDDGELCYYTVVSPGATVSVHV